LIGSSVLKLTKKIIKKFLTIQKTSGIINTEREKERKKEMTKTKQMEKIMHGYWIYHPDWQADGECGYECSECERGVDVNYTYCPHCGVKMDRAMRIMR